MLTIYKLRNGIPEPGKETYKKDKVTPQGFPHRQLLANMYLQNRDW